MLYGRPRLQRSHEVELASEITTGLLNNYLTKHNESKTNTYNSHSSDHTPITVPVCMLQRTSSSSTLIPVCYREPPPHLQLASTRRQSDHVVGVTTFASPTSPPLLSPTTHLRMLGWESLFMSCISLSMALLVLRLLFIFSTITSPVVLWWTCRTTHTPP